LKPNPSSPVQIFHFCHIQKVFSSLGQTVVAMNAAILLVLFWPPVASGDCLDAPTDGKSRYLVNSPAFCICISDLVFADLHGSVDGGAIYVTSSSYLVEIFASTFLMCDV
jgi:hypothetical protein